MIPVRAVVMTLAAFLVAACSSESATTSPTRGSVTAPRDSTPGSAYVGTTDVLGRVILHTPSTSNPDSIIVAPGGSASIKLSRNDKSDGSGGFSYVTELNAAADGSYSFKGIPGGYYLLATTVRLGTWTGFQLTYVAANTASVPTDIHVYRN